MSDIDWENITEEKASNLRLEFKKFYEIAFKSVNESFYWLNMINDSKIFIGSQINGLIKENGEICCMLAAVVIKLKKKN
ncbi:hypothetical protein COT12_01595 [Candidatus Berkelbacteria bacterium CG08_land_8_20_14_0_20_39_8]|uniref:Uncharacterized protein n=1 Tax=Candidatus Berkelbacteria bacterium CG08_land_8_20_14_0_20_39_8 TaxID=1974511 RepID=A0A2M6YCD5_9BACT|nr:MAG: hypothetical protein COT12_01595 [Candidatus Berkelbacteria bacterium CG08_land_8_20_14_0_20_39_8]